MKKSYIIIGLLLGLVLLITGCSTTANSVIDTTNIENLHELTLDIEGMTCESCSIGVEAQLEDVEGVVSADVSLASAQAIVLYDADVVDAETIAAASDVYLATIVSDEVV